MSLVQLNPGAALANLICLYVDFATISTSYPPGSTLRILDKGTDWMINDGVWYPYPNNIDSQGNMAVNTESNIMVNGVLTPVSLVNPFPTAIAGGSSIAATGSQGNPFKQNAGTNIIQVNSDSLMLVLEEILIQIKWSNQAFAQINSIAVPDWFQEVT